MRISLVLAAGLVALMGSSALADKDLIVGQISGIHEYGTVGGISSYALGTTACNNGNQLLSWRNWGAAANQHPVIAQNIYRLKDGQFEQLGASWLKHGFCAADSTVCGSCQSQGSCDWLGVGCSDTYWDTLNGSQSDLGPRSEVNPVTGFFNMPHSSPGFGTINGRIQILEVDVNPSLNAGALYFAEGQYVTPDDAGTAFSYNNSTYRNVTVSSMINNAWNLTMTGATMAQQPAIFAWQANDAGVNLFNVDVPGDGRFWVGSRVTDNGNGTWHYEYAVLNMNSDRAGGSFVIPIGAGANITNAGFHGVKSHSGEGYDNTDWTVAVTSSEISFNSPETHSQNVNANALRWGTLYNFRFDADTPPEAVTGTMGLFKPGAPVSMSYSISGPGAGACLVDLDGSGTVDVLDFFAFIVAFNNGDRAADLDGSGIIDVLDFFAFIVLFDAGCP